MKTIENKPVIIAEGKLVLTGRKFQYILQNGIKKFVWGKKCVLGVLIIFAFVLSSCGDLIDEPHYFVDPSLKYFVDRFFQEAINHDIVLSKNDVDVELWNLPKPELGLTTRLKVKIDRNFFESHVGHSYNDYTDSLAVEYVVFHEMGHYMLGRGHVPNNVYSIMTVDEFWLSDYQTDSIKREKLIDELFTLVP